MRFLCVLLLVFSIVACVTTETSSFSKNISIDKEVEARVQVGLDYLQKGQPEVALFHMREIVEKQPKSPRVNEVLALSLWETGELKLASKYFKTMAKYGGEYSRGRMNYAAFLSTQGEYEKAKEQLLLVTSDIYYPNRGKAFYMLGSVYKIQGDFDAMIQAYERSIRLDRSNVPALIELSEYRYTTGEFAKSYELHKRYRDSVRQSSAKGLLLGIKLAKKFDDKGEEASYALALKNLYPKSNEYLLYLDMAR